MIREVNAVYINPQAYRVFPNIANVLNTGTDEKVRFSGVLSIRDSSGNTKYYSNVSSIDMSEFTDYVDIVQLTVSGSTRLGKWLIQ